MQPFDDRTHEEMDVQNTPVTAFLGHVYIQDQAESDLTEPDDSISTEQMQAVDRVRQRLLQLTQENWSHASTTEPLLSGKGGSHFPAHHQGWQRHLKVLALVAILVILVGSSIFVTGLAKQYQQAQSSAAPTVASSSIVPPNKHGSPLINDILLADPVSQHLLQALQFTQINQSQMADGYQVTLDRAYIDANIMLLGVYAVMPYGPQANQKAQKDQFFLVADNDHTRLTTSGGTNLPVIASSSGRDTSNIQHEQRGLLLAFDAAGIQGNPAQVALNLNMDIHCQGWSPNYKCPRTVNFSLTLPFHASKQVFVPHLAVTQNSKSMTLERMVITQAEARFYVGGWSEAMFKSANADQNPPVGQDSFDQTWYNIKLATMHKTYNLCTLLIPENCPQGAQTGLTLSPHLSIKWGGGGDKSPVYLNNDHSILGFSLLEPFNEHGKMTVTVTKQLLHFVKDTRSKDNYVSTTNDPVNDKSASPWVFTFTLP